MRLSGTSRGANCGEGDFAEGNPQDVEAPRGLNAVDPAVGIGGVAFEPHRQPGQRRRRDQAADGFHLVEPRVDIGQSCTSSSNQAAHGSAAGRCSSASSLQAIRRSPLRQQQVDFARAEAHRPDRRATARRDRTPCPADTPAGRAAATRSAAPPTSDADFGRPGGFPAARTPCAARTTQVRRQRIVAVLLPAAIVDRPRPASDRRCETRHTPPAVRPAAATGRGASGTDSTAPAAATPPSRGMAVVIVPVAELRPLQSLAIGEHRRIRAAARPSRPPAGSEQADGDRDDWATSACTSAP